MKEIDWEKIYKEEFINVPGCWNKCGNYCCNNSYIEHFKILNEKGVVIPLLESEYEYYKSIGGIKNITEDPRKRTFTLKNGFRFSIYLLPCKCAGLCEPHSARPLLCKLYPYMPLVNEYGEIRGYDYAQLVDIFYKNRNDHPCFLIREKEDEITSGLNESLSKILIYPGIIFACMSVEILINYFRGYMENEMRGSARGDVEKFIEKYEWAILSRKPWKSDKFQKDILAAYNKIKNVHGEFLL